MDRLKKKSKKDKPPKYVKNDKNSSFITDVKALKENIKINEILRTVKMTSSMRLKAPRTKKVPQNEDISEIEFVEDGSDLQNGQQDSKSVNSATNHNVVVTSSSSNQELDDEKVDDSYEIVNERQDSYENESNDLMTELDKGLMGRSYNSLESILENKVEVASDNDTKVTVTPKMTQDNVLESPVFTRDRKLSLDHSMLKMREGLSQSEMDLNSLGKSPLQRNTSFFRKKMDSFFKNTSEIFRRQSMNLKSENLRRRGSMSISLQSLNENKSRPTVDFKTQDTSQGSLVSLETCPLGRSVSSLTASQPALQRGQSVQSDLLASQPALQRGQSVQSDLLASQLALSSSKGASDSVHSLNEAYIQKTMLNSRAISMNSGLDTATGPRRRKTGNAHRVTWLASEGLSEYLRRVIRDESNKETHITYSYQDILRIPEGHAYGQKTDTKGRRLSYQRAVSGEDPAPALRYQDSLRKRSLAMENNKANEELANQLLEFSRVGVPALVGFELSASITDDSLAFLLWSDDNTDIEEFIRRRRITAVGRGSALLNSSGQSDIFSIFYHENLSINEEARQAVIRELIVTEADFIRHMIAVVEVFLAAAHAIQSSGRMQYVDTQRLFSNIPDVLNASLQFWSMVIFPMLVDAVDRKAPFNIHLMMEGFVQFRQIFAPYEHYVMNQKNSIDYLRSLKNDPEFVLFGQWCQTQKSCNRLQLKDLLVKPMQRLTKYTLILRRILQHTDDEEEREALYAMERYAKSYVKDLNRCIRQKEELERLEEMQYSIEPFDLDIRDDELDRHFKKYCNLNLRTPMLQCTVGHSRTVIFECDLRFKDHLKEMDVHVVVLTDMLLICKKQSKTHPVPYKLIRSKFMVDKLVLHPKYKEIVSKDKSKDKEKEKEREREDKQKEEKQKEMYALYIVLLDDFNSSIQSCCFTELPKEMLPGAVLKMFDQKLREAKVSYSLATWLARHPSSDLSDFEVDSSDPAGSNTNSCRPPLLTEDWLIERDARERVTCMLQRGMGGSTDYDTSIRTDSIDGEVSTASGMRTPGLINMRYPLKRNSTGGSSSARQSRLSSFQQSTSGASHEEPVAGPSRCIYRAGSSVEHVIPPQNPDDAVTSITVKVVSEGEPEAPLYDNPPQPSPLRSGAHSPSSCFSCNTLRVQQPQGMVHSLTDLTVDTNLTLPKSGSRSPATRSHVTPPRHQRQLSSSDKMYQSHQELMQRNRLSASQHQYLTPDQRGVSYPPPSPTRSKSARTSPARKDDKADRQKD